MALDIDLSEADIVVAIDDLCGINPTVAVAARETSRDSSSDLRYSLA